jgi:hypothetical protein
MIHCGARNKMDNDCDPLILLGVLPVQDMVRQYKWDLIFNEFFKRSTRSLLLLLLGRHLLVVVIVVDLHSRVVCGRRRQLCKIITKAGHRS